MIDKLIKSVLEQDRTQIVLCNLDHEIVYMNKMAIERYAKSGGAELLGKSLLDCHNAKSVEMIKKVVAWFAESPENNMIYTFHNDKENKDVYMIALRDEDGTLIGYYEKHIFRDRESGALYDTKNPIVGR